MMIAAKSAHLDVSSLADPAEVNEQLEKLLASDSFRRTPSLNHLLRYLVSKKVDAEGQPPREAVIAMDVFHRGRTFDSRLDKIVGAHAHRLRKSLYTYDEKKGAAEKLRVAGYCGRLSYRCHCHRRDTLIFPGGGSPGLPSNRPFATIRVHAIFDMLRFETAGESHGECLLATLTGLPAQIPVSLETVNRELWRRQQGFGRGGRMKIETDTAEIVAGVRHSKTIGSPIGIIIRNRDWKNWTESMPVEDFPGSEAQFKHVNRPRPGHADLAGAIKYDYPDARYILERASARETTARVAVGALAKAFLRQFGIEVLSHVVAVGPVKLERPGNWEEIEALSRRDEVLLGCVDAEVEQLMKAVVDEAYRTGDTIGGIFEVVARGVPIGLGSHIAWDTRLDGKLAQAIVSMQAVKGVEIGFAEDGAASFGSKVQDSIHYEKEQRHFYRGDNRAGGIEGGMSNGQEIRVRGLLKPISTLRRPLESVDLDTRDPAKAAYERSDVCVVPAAGVIGEAMVAIVLAGSMLEKFGGDSLSESKRNFESYRTQVSAF